VKATGWPFTCKLKTGTHETERQRHARRGTAKGVARETAYQQAKAKALTQLSATFRLGGGKMPVREALHDRQDLR
jgi:hypothetical protein